jgi:hypothetical protein
MPSQNAASVRLRALGLPPRLYPPECLYVLATGCINRGIQGGKEVRWV